MKKSLKYIFAIAIIWCVSASPSISPLHAQYEDLTVSSDTTLSRGEHNVGWLRSHILDNWYLDLQSGGQFYYGFEDRKGPFFDRLTGNVEGHLGRWIFPMVGLRAGLGLGSSHGFISVDSYLQNRDAIRDIGGFGTSYGVNNQPTTIGDTTLADGALGGYYFPFDGDNNLLIQKWKYIYGGADIMVNLSYLKPYKKVNPDRRWNHIAYIGFNVKIGLCEDHPQITATNTNFAAEGHIGYICKYALTPHLNLQADARLSMIEGLFDRERIPTVEKVAPDFNLNIMAGLSYDFNFRSDQKRRNYYVENHILPYNVQKLPKFMSYMQIEDVDIINVVNTLNIYQTDTIDDLEIQQYVKKLQDKADSLLNAAKTIPDDTPLDSILLKQLLPYEMVFFDLDKWDIRPTEEMKIAKMARLMKAFPNQKFYLYGSADSKTGTVKRNNFLSHNRADIVYNKLIIEYGIKAEQMEREYLGGILDYDPFILNRTTVIIMDHPAVRKAFNEMKSQRKAGGGVGVVE